MFDLIVSFIKGSGIKVHFAIYLVILSALGVFYFQNTSLREDLQETASSLAVREREVSELVYEMDVKDSFISKQKVTLETLMSDRREVEKENSKLNLELEGYKNREEVVIKKPSLVERRVNSASERIMSEWGCNPQPTCRNSNN